MKRKLIHALACFLLLGAYLPTRAQSRVITGKIVNDKSAPLAGASVVVKNRPSTGTTTSESGIFHLTVSSSDDSLVVTAIGYEAQTVAISNDLQISLSSGRRTLDEVVVIGYGTQKRVDLTAPVTTV